MSSSSMTVDVVRVIVERVLHSGKFYIAPPARLRVAFVPAVRIAWEVFRGHLLEPAHTRETIVVDTWNVFVDAADAPAEALASVYYQADRDQIHITRQILTYGFEAIEESPGVIASRGVQKWVRELVGSLDAGQLAPDELESELGACVFAAVIGISRLPVTSIESPLPAFSLGQLGYSPGLSASSAWSDAIEFFRATVAHSRDSVEVAKALETALRSVAADELPKLADVFAPLTVGDRAQSEDLAARVLHALFNHVALSPYTQFVDRLVGLLVELEASGRVPPAAIADIFSYMLRHLYRHLTAFDLTLFHNFGANYPDALFLDELLAAYLTLIGRHADLLLDEPLDVAGIARDKRWRRRALRQACLVRKTYEGHLVPDAPTSMGENLRVLPAPFARVTDEQIVQPASRRRRLYEDDPLENKLTSTTSDLLRASIADLAQPGELKELGTAVFLARPLGILKAQREIDRTPLLAYEAFSRSIATRRLDQMHCAGWIASEECERLAEFAKNMAVDGLPATAIATSERPGVVSLADMRKAAGDFIILRTTSDSLRDLMAHYDLAPLGQIAPQIADWLLWRGAKIVVLVEPEVGAAARLKFYDTSARLRLELAWANDAPQATYRLRWGSEFPQRLQVVQVGERSAGDQIALRDVRDLDIWLKLH